MVPDAMRPPRLLTERLLLRGYEPRDVAADAAVARDPEVQRHLGGVKDDYAAFAVLATHAGHWALRGYGEWVVERRADGAFLGRVGLWRPPGWPGLEVGWKLARAAWGGGYATEAARAAIGWAWTTQDADELISLIVPDNTASQRVARRLGHVNAGSIELPLGTTDRWVLRRPPGDDAYAFRTPTVDDAQRIGELVHDLLRDYRAISPPGWEPEPVDLVQERDLLATPDVRCVVAEPGGVLAGAVGWRPAATSRLRSPDPGLLHFVRLFVHRGWHGTGLATKLMDMAIADARARGFTSMILFTPAAQGRARRFYERLGWRTDGTPGDGLRGIDTVAYTYTL
jgi:RimJ/RimL family protein N-acetyltransferase/GNAT superfamily N-acetyltransferase